MNTTFNCSGRFGNIFFVNMALHFIANKNNLHTSYKYHQQMIDLGVELFDGKNTYSDIIEISDTNFFKILTKQNNTNKSISFVKDTYAQTSEFSHFLRQYFNEPEKKRKIINSNRFNSRFNNNNDVFIHIRLGDIAHYNIHNFEYFDSVLQTISFENGYISSDTITHPTCQKLIEKYNLHIFQSHEVDTIQFANTCKYVVLSSGTFSWLIGLFAYYSKVYYPNIVRQWHGDIFVFPDWIRIKGTYGLTS